jgi:hypothetical protein
MNKMKMKFFFNGNKFESLKNDVKSYKIAW